MRKLLVALFCGGFACWSVACGPCRGGGQNGVGPPGPDEFQLVFNNIVSRESDLTIDYADGAHPAQTFTLCQETEYITVGNFPVSTQTIITIHSMVSDSDCHVSPCCSSNCNAQLCQGQPLVDTTPFAGGIYSTGLIWLQ